MAENILLPTMVGKPLGGGDLRSGIVGYNGAGGSPAGLGAGIGNFTHGLDRLVGVLGRIKGEKDEEMLNRFLVDANNERMEVLRTMRDMQGVNAEDALAMFHLSNIDIRDRYANAAPEHMRERFLIAYDRGEGHALDQVDAYQRAEARKLEQTELAKNLVEIGNFTDQHIQEFSQTKGINAAQNYDARLRMISEGWDEYIAKAPEEQRERLQLEKLNDMRRASRQMMAHRDAEVNRATVAANTARITQIVTRAVLHPEEDWNKALSEELLRQKELNGWSAEMFADKYGKAVDAIVKDQITMKIHANKIGEAKAMIDAYDDVADGASGDNDNASGMAAMPSEAMRMELREMVAEAGHGEENHRWAADIVDRYRAAFGKKNVSVDQVLDYNNDVLEKEVIAGRLKPEDARARMALLSRGLNKARKAMEDQRQEKMLNMVNNVVEELGGSNALDSDFENAEQILARETVGWQAADRTAAREMLAKRFGRAPKAPEAVFREQSDMIARAIESGVITNAQTAADFCSRMRINQDAKVQKAIDTMLKREKTFFNFARIDGIAKKHFDLDSAPNGFALYLAQVTANKDAEHISDDDILKAMTAYLKEDTVRMGYISYDNGNNVVYVSGNTPGANIIRTGMTTLKKTAAMSEKDLTRHFQMLERRGAFSSQGYPLVEVDGVYGTLRLENGKWMFDMGNGVMRELDAKDGVRLYAKYNRLTTPSKTPGQEIIWHE